MLDEKSLHYTQKVDISYLKSVNIMAVSLHESFDRSCRLCAEVQDVTIMIFSAEAAEMHLQNKLNKYLLIEVGLNLL